MEFLCVYCMSSLNDCNLKNDLESYTEITIIARFIHCLILRFYLVVYLLAVNGGRSFTKIHIKKLNLLFFKFAAIQIVLLFMIQAYSIYLYSNRMQETKQSFYCNDCMAGAT